MPLTYENFYVVEKGPLLWIDAVAAHDCPAAAFGEGASDETNDNVRECETEHDASTPSSASVTPATSLRGATRSRPRMKLSHHKEVRLEEEQEEVGVVGYECM